MGSAWRGWLLRWCWAWVRVDWGGSRCCRLLLLLCWCRCCELMLRAGPPDLRPEALLRMQAAESGVVVVDVLLRWPKRWTKL